MKRKFSFLPILFLLLCANSVNAQEAKRNTVKVQTYSAIKVPADEIIFSINLNVTKQNAQEAYDFHKNKEKDLIIIGALIGAKVESEYWEEVPLERCA